MADTLADRIMAAVDELEGVSRDDSRGFALGTGGDYAAVLRARARVSALVAEACAPQSERVCRWPRDGRRFVTGWRIIELADGQEETDG